MEQFDFKILDPNFGKFPGTLSDVLVCAFAGICIMQSYNRWFFYYALRISRAKWRRGIRFSGTTS